MLRLLWVEIFSGILVQCKLIFFHVINKPALSKKQFSEIFFASFKMDIFHSKLGKIFEKKFEKII